MPSFQGTRDLGAWGRVFSEVWVRVGVEVGDIAQKDSRGVDVGTDRGVVGGCVS
jgi:hypothetical protein